MQALLTLTGSTARAFAAYRICEEGKRLDAGESSAQPSQEAQTEFDEEAFLLKLALVAGCGALAVKYGELFAPSFFMEPNYVKALALMALPTAATTALVANGGSEGGKPKLSMADVKSFGVAGTLSYVITELAFWAVAFPLAYSWYRVAEGSWLDLSNAADKAKLLGAGTVFINGVRLAAALALAPTVEKALKSAGVDLKKGEEGDGEGGAGAAAEAAEEKVKENA